MSRLCEYWNGSQFDQFPVTATFLPCETNRDDNSYLLGNASREMSPCRKSRNLDLDGAIYVPPTVLLQKQTVIDIIEFFTDESVTL